MQSAAGRAGYQELWQKQLGPLRMMQATSGRKAIAVLTAAGQVILLDHTGQELWKIPAGAGVRTISLADTLDVLAVDDAGNALLIDARGQVQWKKRPAPALYGLISPDGQSVVLVTREPTVVMADRQGRVRWTYRNLLKVPAALDVSASGRTVAFACLDERGEGLQAVGPEGQPYDAFMGLDPLQDLAVSADGQITVALDRGRGIFCINCVKSFGVWRGKLNADFSGVSWADEVKNTLIYSKDGLLSILDAEGQPAWEYRFPGPLLRARLTADGQAIWYAMPEGRVGCLVSTASQDLNRLEFLDVEPPPPIEPAGQTAFRKIWLAELAGRLTTGSRPLAHTWMGTDQVEYALVWDGRDTIRCLNDAGDDIWNTRLPSADVADIAVSPEADVALAVGKGGVIGFKGDGNELCRFFGSFRSVHVFATGAVLLLTEKGQVRYYRHAGQFTRALETGGAVTDIHGSGSHAWLVGKEFVLVVDPEGNPTGRVETGSEPLFQRLDAAGGHLVVGTRAGLILMVNERAELDRRLAVEGGAEHVVFHNLEGAIFIGHAGTGEVTLLRTRAGTRTRIAIPAGIKAMSLHPRGAVIANGIDELILLGADGRMTVRSTFPDRILQLLPCNGGEGVYVLGESGFGRYGSEAGSHGGPSTVGFLEV
ncbi:MAG TPA: PQQ-binding-like beta-propeller repeat protein [Candidatus Ozemobacteraceae bacterium]|nr:PQQ-binding-like beta-propeller repeat protein [Candidatus Ozemobacteraceae bacterium]